MRKFIILVMMALISVTVISQESTKEQKKAAREAKKEEKKRAEAERAIIIDASIQAHQFVLEADFLGNKYGERIVVLPSLNFIGIDNDTGTFQFGNGMDVGYNGVGGITVDGKVVDFKTSVNKNGIHSIEFRVSSSLGTIFVRMSVAPNGNADAVISGNTSTKLNYFGRLVPLNESRVFKGTTF
jgi:hypothetical protein